jgi:hypothetical protein
MAACAQQCTVMWQWRRILCAADGFRTKEASMLRFRHIGCTAIAAVFALALAIDAADARRGGGGGMRGGGGGFSGGGMRGGGGAAMRGGGRAHVSNPIARPGPGNRGDWANRPGNRPPGWANRPGYNPGWGYRPGYGWGAAAAAGAIGAGWAASNYYDPYYSGYGYYDDSYAAAAEPSDAIAECARRFKTYDPASQTYIKRKGVRASCP